MRTSGLFGALLSIALPLVAANPLNAAVLGRGPGIDEVARRTPGDVARRATVGGPYMNAAFIHYVGGPLACGPINSNFFVALDASQFGTGFPGPNCNVPITVQVGSHSMTAVILDVVRVTPFSSCPGDGCSLVLCGAAVRGVRGKRVGHVECPF
ncbi:hypothetical protein SCP_1000230 [Sparassis crispa]|uniref:Uncharacterized protein n=1 Tax=Sparassis crispa TaxID=139825 RepID=A0A401GX34_9APHY|nr:hypothetical protein SCP_1000230 [Sparassis crispa]GBE86781.1 hypothetical protein SCP_1000230 [Sparassis crispa]